MDATADPDDDFPRDKEALLTGIRQSRTALEATLDRLGPEQLAGPADAQGWSVKDHLAHLAAWERSMAYLLRGRPRHEGLGVPEETYLRAGVDEVNAAIHARTRDRSPDEALADFRDAHRELLAALEPLSYDDLLRPYSHYLPDEPGEETGEPVLTRLLGNTTEHYAEHLGWIEDLAR